jgi:hypothetical protein
MGSLLILNNENNTKQVGDSCLRETIHFLKTVAGKCKLHQLPVSNAGENHACTVSSHTSSEGGRERTL